MIKKIYALVVALILAVLPLTMSPTTVYADTGGGQVTTQEELENTLFLEAIVFRITFSAYFSFG